MADIKIIIKAIVKLLTFICNQSFLAGTFLHGMKIARVFPFFKQVKVAHVLIIGQFTYYPNCQFFLETI